MKRHAPRTNSIRTRIFCLAVLAALLSAAPYTAFAAKGGRSNPVGVTFDDLFDDAIQSDGLGPYEASIGRKGSLVLSTGDRTLFFDFSRAINPWWFHPFAGDAADIDNVTVTVSSLDQASATVVFAFQALDPYAGTRISDWELRMTVSVSQSNGFYYLESASDAELWWLNRKNASHGRGTEHRYGPEWELAGIFEMPWGAEVSP